ncbi:hypothetical protein GW17_00031268 [Ensete ventricosum]|nr:hypothetical protein GW17_00031268 [Ensete ventricosum]
MVHLRALTYKKAIAKLYNRRLRPWQIKADDLVVGKAKFSDPTQSRGKLAPNWEGPYRIESTIQPGTYTLVIMEGK